MKDQQRNYVNQWLEKAEHDLLAARLILEHQPIILDISCFHSQQIVEKYLKTFLIFHSKDFPKTHNIDLLLKTCSAIGERFKEVDVKNLEDFAVRGRYPHDFFNPLNGRSRRILSNCFRNKGISYKRNTRGKKIKTPFFCCFTVSHKIYFNNLLMSFTI